MSAQCWCYSCAGRVVTRQTWTIHGRKDQPDRPVVEAECRSLPLLSLAEGGSWLGPAPEVSSSSDEEELESSYSQDPLGLGLPRDSENEIGKGKLTAAEVTLLLLDWIHSHKTTDKSAMDVWQLCQLLVPGGVDLPTFHTVKNVLKRAETKFVQRIDVCINECVAFWDSKHLPTPYRHAHRHRCPVCNANRY